MASKTREKLIDVARQLFVNKGVEKTTMNDIANASSKGRRTIYTYFKNKREIYNAVIERESEVMVSELRKIQLSTQPVAERMSQFLAKTIDMSYNSLNRHGSLMLRLSRDYRRVERIQRAATDKVDEMLRALAAEGVAAGVFSPASSHTLPTVLAVLLPGLDTLALREPQRFSTEAARRESINSIVAFMMTSLLSAPPAE